VAFLLHKDKHLGLKSCGKGHQYVYMTLNMHNKLEKAHLVNIDL